jgi:hypothetical protein
LPILTQEMSDTEDNYFDISEEIYPLPQEIVRDIYEEIKWECRGTELFNDLLEEDLLSLLYPNYDIYNPYEQ